jgi:polyhydroxyalkanoate synthase subunit PhaC
VFSTPRANDLIWSYVALPGPMYCWYVRNTCLENSLKVPGKTVQCGVPVDLSNIKVPVYLLAAREDPIVPWETANLASKLLGGDVKFVLGTSGHVAGVVNPDSHGKRNYSFTSDLGAEPDDWLAEAQGPGKLVARLGPLAQGTLDRYQSRTGEARKQNVSAD